MKLSITLILIALLILFTSCNQNNEEVLLKDKYQSMFYIGAAPSHLPLLEKDALSLMLIEKEFNSITPENLLKWEIVHPYPDSFSFSLSDKFVELGQKNNMFIVGHTLVWHNQTPDWVFEKKDGTIRSRDELVSLLKNHILTVVGRYRGKINAWDVVNEALNDDGTMRDTKWRQIIGDDYLKLAFEFAYQADPETELYYNDFNMFKPAKRQAAIKIVKELIASGVKVDGIGMQGHWGLKGPSNDEIIGSMEDFKAAGVKTMITELDINVLPNPWDYEGAEVSTSFELLPESNPYTDGLPDSVSTKQAKKYADIFKIFVDYHEIIDRVTFWGVHDGVSWKNNWPVRGRTDYPLLFDRNGNRKKVYYSIVGLTK